MGEVFKEYSEKGHTELPTLTIIQGGGTVKREDSDRNLMYDETNLSNYKMVRKDDFIVHLRSFEGGLEKASLDGIISPAYHTFHSDEADSRFYYPYFRSFEFIKHKLVPHVYGIRDGRSIDIEGMKSIEIPYTSLSEQRKIGDYLELLDHLITLHQRKNIYFYEKVTLVWEQRKLGDLVGIYDGVHQTPDYQDSGIMFLSVENIATLKSEKYISEEAFERDYNVYPEKGDILMTRIGDVGTTNVVETAEKVAFYVSLALLKPNGIDSYFLSNAMKTNDFQKGLRERTLVTAIPQKINKDEIGKINIFITNNDEEQKKIGAYFSSLDHLITLHQCKCHLLLKLLHNDWEQRKLGEVFKEYSEKGHTELPTLTIIQGGGTVKREDSDRNLMYDETNLSNYKMVRKDDFIVHLRSFEGGLEKASLDGIISPAYHTFHSDEADSRFYYPYFRSFEFIKHKLVPHVYGIRDGRSIDIEGMKSIEIPYTSLSEQRKIGDYLELLDHLITLHHRKYICKRQILRLG